MMITGIPSLAELRDYTRFGRRFSLSVWFVVGVFALSALIYTWKVATPLVTSDDWYYTDTLIKHYQEGNLGLVDIIGKRPNDNSQPLNRLTLLMLTRWFQMDLALQGILGVLIALTCAVLLSCLALRAWPAPGKTPWARALLPLGFTAILLSLNPVGLFTWPQVTMLTFMGSLGAIIFLYVTACLVERGAWIWAAIAALVTLVTIDTFGILAVMAAVVLLAHRALTGPKKERRGTVAVGISAFIALIVYQVSYKQIVHLPSTPLNGDNISIAVNYIAAHWTDAWKTFVIPFGMSVYEPVGHLGHTWLILIPLSVMLWCGHIWFWREYFRDAGRHRLAFVGAGLMLYFYATVAGMLLDRVPRFDFDYLQQPRYVAFYELQLVAMLLMAVIVLSTRSEPAKAASIASITVLLMCGMLAFNVYFTARAWVAASYIQTYYHRMAEQINQLANDPTKTPDPCYHEVSICTWTPERRAEVLQVLRQGNSNIFSAEFRQRHGYEWVDPSDHKTPIGLMP